MNKQKTSKTVSFTFPPDICLKLEAITNIGYYDSVSEFVRDSIRSFLNTRKDIRIAIAYQLYQEKKISFLKAVEIIGSPPKETKELFSEKEL